MGFSSGSRTSSITFSKQGKKCFVSAAFASKQAKFLCGFCVSHSIDNLRLVNLAATLFAEYKSLILAIFFQSLAGWDTLSLRVIIKAHIVQQAPSQMGGNSSGVQNVEGVTPHHCCCYPWDVEQGVAGPFGSGVTST